MIRKILISVLLVMVCVNAFADAQGDRKKFIDQLISQGIFQKIEVAGDLPYLYVTAVFKSLDFQTKANCVSVAYGYYSAQNPAYDVLVILDGPTGARLGEYVKGSGLKLL